MAYLPSLPDPTNLADVIKQFPKGWATLLDFHDEVLRSEGPLTIAERELIAAYVSGLNGCRFCYNAHTVYAESFGVAGEVFAPLMQDADSAPVEEAMRPILAYARLLTLDPKQVSEAHVQAILDAGWPEAAVAETSKVVALFAFMNRIVMGMGVADFTATYDKRREAVRRQPIERRRHANETQLGASSYRQYGEQLGLLKP